MIAARIPLMVLSVALLGALPVAWGQASSPTASRRPLPHSDILTLPPDGKVPQARVEEVPTEPAASAEVLRGEPGTSISEQAIGDAAAPDPSGHSLEGKEITRRGGSAGSTRFDRESQGLTRRETTRSPGLVRDLWPLVAVLGVIAAAAFAMKKFMPSRRLTAGSQVLQIVAQTHVTAKQQLMLVKVGRQLVLLGVSPDRINSLSTVDDPDQVAVVLGQAASAHAGSMSRAFVESMQDEADAYVEVAEEDATSATQGQVRGLLKKVRTLAGK